MDDRLIVALRKEKLFGSLPNRCEGNSMCAMGMRSRAVQGKVVPSPIFLKESVPVSSYQQAGIPVDLKRKIARLGINMLLKMVSSWAWRGCAGPACGPNACGKWWGHCTAALRGGQAQCRVCSKNS